MAEHAAPPCADGSRLTVVLGHCRINFDDAQHVSPGQLVPLDESADCPVEVYCDGKLIGRGQLLSLDGTFCVRMTEIAANQSLSRAA
jgi:flagellar motor switch protein FliN